MKKTVAVMLVLSLILAAGLASASAGSDSDPVVTLSYINKTYLPSIMSRAQSLIDEKFEGMLDDFKTSLDETASSSGTYASALISAGYTAENIQNDALSAYSLTQSAVIAGPAGTQFTLLSGSAVAYSPGGVLVDVTDGTEINSGSALAADHLYMVSDSARYGIRITSDIARVRIGGDFSMAGIAYIVRGDAEGDYFVKYEKYADLLNSMGLFVGTGSGYELDRSATRAESLVMLIRLLGEEDKALACTNSNPFGDVPQWAQRYVSYGYSMGYTQGVSETTFGSGDTVTEQQYLTFLLRALGYSDSGNDFTWTEAPDYAVSVGLLTSSQEKKISSLFYRDQMVFASYMALKTTLKNSTSTLLDKLVNAGAVSADNADTEKVVIG